MNMSASKSTNLWFFSIISHHKNLSLAPRKIFFKSDAYLWISNISNIVSYIASFPYVIAKDIFIIQTKIEIFVCSTNLIFLYLSD